MGNLFFRAEGVYSGKQMRSDQGNRLGGSFAGVRNDAQARRPNAIRPALALADLSTQPSLIVIDAFPGAKALERATVPHQPELAVAVGAVVLHTFCFMSQTRFGRRPTLAQSTIAQMAVQKMHVIVQKKQVAFVDNGPQYQTGRGADVGAAQTHKANRAVCRQLPWPR